VLTGGLSACISPDEVSSLDDRVGALERRFDAAEARASEMEAAANQCTATCQEAEARASRMFQQKLSGAGSARAIPSAW
jgi:hypothetical protein